MNEKDKILMKDILDCKIDKEFDLQILCSSLAMMALIFSDIISGKKDSVLTKNDLSNSLDEKTKKSMYKECVGLHMRVRKLLNKRKNDQRIQ